MARKKIREYNAKALLKEHLKRLRGLELPIEAVQVRSPFLDDPPCLRATISLPPDVHDTQRKECAGWVLSLGTSIIVLLALTITPNVPSTPRAWQIRERWMDGSVIV